MRLTLQPDNVQTYDIMRIGSRITIGRKPDCDIILTDAVVSGLHCYITVTSTSTAIVEDGSTNGTYVNAIKIGRGSKVDIRSGDILTLGKPAAMTNPSTAVGCINFKVSFDGQESEGGNTHVTSIVWKAEVEDLKVVASKAEHRAAESERKHAEVSRRLVGAEADIKRITDTNIELSVRNESMRGEIESLRARMIAAEALADDNQKKAETLQSKMEHFHRDMTELAELKAQFNITNGSLKDEVAALQHSHMDLSGQLREAVDARQRLTKNLMALKEALSSSIQLCQDPAPAARSPNVIQGRLPETSTFRGYPQTSMY